MMLILNGDGITAEDIPKRVCLMVFFASAAPERYHGSTKAENLAMGRAIMRLAPLQRRGKRYASRAVHLLGEMARDYLYVFGMRLHDRVKKDAEKVCELKKATMDLDILAEVPTDDTAAHTDAGAASWAPDGIGDARKHGPAVAPCTNSAATRRLELSCYQWRPTQDLRCVMGWNSLVNQSVRTYE